MKITKKDKKKIWKAAVGLSKKRGDSLGTSANHAFNCFKREFLALKKWKGEEIPLQDEELPFDLS